jgi:hypothetical protein
MLESKLTRKTPRRQTLDTCIAAMRRYWNAVADVL